MEKKVARPLVSPKTGYSSQASNNSNNQSSFTTSASSLDSSYKQKACRNGSQRDTGRRYKYNRGYGSDNSYQRKLANNKVKSREGETSATHLPVEKVSKHGVNANHLLNFSYAPLNNEDSGRRNLASRYGWKSVKSRCPVLTKEQFLQANCQFVVHESSSLGLVQYIADPDRMIEWELIEQVRLTDNQLAICPICLDVPVAAKITKCAHIYCWPCILHYLSLSERSWAKCPICFDAIEEKDLKSVSSSVTHKYNVGDEITLLLMKRERDSLYVRPCCTWMSSGSGKVYGVNGSNDDLKYSKILSATTEEILDLIALEKQQLMSLLKREETESLEASYIRASVESLASREASFNRKSKNKAVVEDLMEDTRAEEYKTPMLNVIRDPKVEVVVCPDPFADEIEKDMIDSPAVDTVESSESLCEAAAASVNNEKLNADISDDRMRVRSGNSVSSTDSGELEQVTADLRLPPTGTQPGPSSGSKRTEVYYFYQAADGQRIYLHSINTRILAAQYGSLELAPRVLTATIVEREENSMTKELRKRLKYLSHLPLYSQFTVCEVALRPPTVSSAVLQHFDEELGKRKKARNRRQRVENRQQNRAMAEERRKMGRFPDMRLSLDSERHFPIAADLGYDNTVPDPPPGTDLLSHDTVHEETPIPNQTVYEAPLTTPFSFAQAMKGNNTAAAVWPRVQPVAYQSRLSSHAKVNKGSNEEGDTMAPTFQESFSADFDHLLNLAVKGNNDTSGHSKGRKNKRNKKSVMLMSTSGQRANN